MVGQCFIQSMSKCIKIKGQRLYEILKTHQRLSIHQHISNPMSQNPFLETGNRVIETGNGIILATYRFGQVFYDNHFFICLCWTE